ncbi:lysine--tRNA ligase [Mycoplasma todarodis]|uniref:lysine--tRNA ligase n=1 Tax=Mycoplasma todarodis TaxID=1937191 RepID=UPI0030049D44
MRSYFDDLGYMEADTPVLQPILGGASAKPFSTHFNALDMEFYLRVATELPLKKLIVGGIERVYEIGRLFRNEGVDATHNPEFTTIEFYEAHSDLAGMMKRTEELFQFLANKLGKDKIMFDGKEINVSGEFAKVNMAESVKEKSGVDFTAEMTIEEARQHAVDHKIKIEKYFSIGHILEAFFEEYVEETLIQPTFVYGHPIEISPLAAKNLDDPRFTDRAELFINGKEFANMFTELNDPIDQLERFEAQLAEREAGNDEASEIDMDFVEALEHAMPPAGGCGIGIDRLVMLFTDSQSIRDVLLFPHLKNRG